MRSHPLARATRALIPAVALLGCRSAGPRVAVSTPGVLDSVEVGYGTVARRDVTGAVGSVSGEVAQRSSPTTMADMLAGRVAGVEVRALPGGGTSVTIRGLRSLRGDGEPLFVVDGVPQHGGTNGALRDLDPRDVRSIDVLKDAGSTAAYGVRGANGVILITTNRPH